MSDEGRHLWVHNQVWSTRSLPKEAALDVCVICRVALKTCCMNCLCKFNTAVAIEECQRYWKFILLARNRRGSFFSHFSLALVSRIYKSILKAVVWSTDCPLQRPTACNHVYHTHCFDKWRAKRNNCPIDNIECSSVLHYAEDPYIHHRLELVYWTPSKTTKTWEDILREQEMKANRPDAVKATTILVVKKRCPGHMERGEIHNEVRKKPHLEELEGHQIDAALDHLTTRKFLEYDAQQDSYKYLP